MIDLSLFAGKPVAVMGLARSGLAAARALAAGGAEVRAWDDGDAGRDAAVAVGIPLADLSAPESWKGVETLVLSPGIPHTHPAPHISATRARNDRSCSRRESREGRGRVWSCDSIVRRVVSRSGWWCGPR